MRITIDAQNKKLGRIASEAAKHLMGKTKPTYVPNAICGDDVEILNASKISIDDKKFKTKTYLRYSGYPGGQSKETMDHMANRRGYAELFKLAVYNMLPSNKLRSRMMKKLTVKE